MVNLKKKKMQLSYKFFKKKAQVIFTGKETRMSMNSKVGRIKIGVLDLELNFLSKLLFFMMALISFILIIISGLQGGVYDLILFFKYTLLLNSIIPISMRVNLELGKLIYSFKIDRDKDILGSQARNTNITEELGRIQYLLTDKTGTLTQNSMIFKKMSFEKLEAITNENIEKTIEIVGYNCKNTQGPLEDIEFKVKEGLAKKKRKFLFDRDQHYVLLK